MIIATPIVTWNRDILVRNFKEIGKVQKTCVVGEMELVNRLFMVCESYIVYVLDVVGKIQFRQVQFGPIGDQQGHIDGVYK